MLPKAEISTQIWDPVRFQWRMVQVRILLHFCSKVSTTPPFRYLFSLPYCTCWLLVVVHDVASFPSGGHKRHLRSGHKSIYLTCSNVHISMYIYICIFWNTYSTITVHAYDSINTVYFIQRSTVYSLLGTQIGTCVHWKRPALAGYQPQILDEMHSRCIVYMNIDYKYMLSHHNSSSFIQAVY